MRSTEWRSTQFLSPETGPLGPSTEAPISESFALGQRNDSTASYRVLLSQETRALLNSFPVERAARTDSFKQVARSDEIALMVIRSLGGTAAAVGDWFPCVLHRGVDLARLVRDRKGEIVYHDPTLEVVRREFQTIPELACAVLTGIARRLKKLEHVEWRLRILHEAELLELPPATVASLPARSLPSSTERGSVLRCCSVSSFSSASRLMPASHTHVVSSVSGAG